jgi:hypothetical protein
VVDLDQIQAEIATAMFRDHQHDRSPNRASPTFLQQGGMAMQNRQQRKTTS